MTDLLPDDPETVGHRLKKQEVIPESLFAKRPLAVRPLDPVLGRWVFLSVGHHLKRRTRQRTAIVSTDLFMRHCPTEAKRIKTTAVPVLSVPINAITAHLVSHEVSHITAQLVYRRTRRITVGAEHSLGGLECRSCSCFVSPTLVESGQICQKRKGSQSRFCFHDCSQPILDRVGSHDSKWWVPILSPTGLGCFQAISLPQIQKDLRRSGH